MDLNFQFSSLSEMIYMGGHGLYVWSCYIITFAGIGYLMLYPKVKIKHFLKVHRAIARRQHQAPK